MTPEQFNDLTLMLADRLDVSTTAAEHATTVAESMRFEGQAAAFASVLVWLAQL